MTADEFQAASCDGDQEKPLVPEHELLHVVGRGSSGRVWLAKNILGSYRAVKVVHAAEFRHRRPFEQEISGILKFEPISRQHEGLVDILQAGFSPDQSYFYYVMELADDVVAGPKIDPKHYQPQTLAHDRNKLQRLPVEECVRLGAAVASALSFLHKNGLTHRDIKPANIIFVGGSPKLADIGLVSDVAAPVSRIGTEGFFPPEGSGSVRADIYSLGKVLYELATGNSRHAYPSIPVEIVAQTRRSDFIELNKIILKACRTKPWQRYQTADALLLALLNFQFNTTALTRQRRFRASARAMGVIGLCVAVGVILSLIVRIFLLSRGTH